MSVVFCRDDCPELRSRIGHSMLFHPVSQEKQSCNFQIFNYEYYCPQKSTLKERVR